MDTLLVGALSQRLLRTESSESLPPLGPLPGCDSLIRGIMSKFELAG